MFFCSDLAVCDRGHHRDDPDFSEDETTHCYCITEGGKQVSLTHVVFWKTVLTSSSYIEHLATWRPVVCLVFRAISYIMSTLFYPIITFILLAICIAYWAVTAMYPSDCTTQMESSTQGCCFCDVISTAAVCDDSDVCNWSVGQGRFDFNQLVLSFLASSGNAVYKVTPADDKCTYANLTCNPKVCTTPHAVNDTAVYFCGVLNDWRQLKTNVKTRWDHICSLLSDLQSDQHYQSVSRFTMHVCLLRWRERVPPLHLSSPSV